MKKHFKGFIASAILLSIVGLTGCGGDAKVVEKKYGNGKVDPDNEQPVLPYGILDENAFYSPTYIKVHKDAEGAQIFCRNDIKKNPSYFSNKQWHKWNKQTKKWDDIQAAVEQESKIKLIPEPGVDYYCFTYTHENDSGTVVPYVSPVITIECGTNKTKTIGNYVYRDGTYSAKYDSSKELVGYVADVNNYGYPTLILSKFIFNSEKTRSEAIAYASNKNQDFTNEVDYKWDLPDLEEFQQVFANAPVINESIRASEDEVKGELISDQLYLTKEVKGSSIITGRRNQINIDSATESRYFFIVSPFNLGKTMPDPELTNTSWYGAQYFYAREFLDIKQLKYGMYIPYYEDGEIKADSMSLYSDLNCISRDNNYLTMNLKFGTNPGQYIGNYSIRNGCLKFYSNYGTMTFYNSLGKIPEELKGTWKFDVSNMDPSLQQQYVNWKLTIDDKYALFDYSHGMEWYCVGVVNNQLFMRGICSLESGREETQEQFDLMLLELKDGKLYAYLQALDDNKNIDPSNYFTFCYNLYK